VFFHRIGGKRSFAASATKVRFELLPDWFGRDRSLFMNNG